MRSIALILLALCASPAALRAQTEAPDADEYAVWSAVLDSVMPGEPSAWLADSAFNRDIVVGERTELIMAGSMSRHRFDSTAVADFLRRSSAGVRLRPFPAARPFRLVKTESGEEFTSRMQGPHLAVFSRPGFSRDHARAVIAVATYCGAWCARGSVYELAREPGGGWRITRGATVWVT